MSQKFVLSNLFYISILSALVLITILIFTQTSNSFAQFQTYLSDQNTIDKSLHDDSHITKATDESEVALVNGHLVNLDEFHIGFVADCPDFHYHALNGEYVTALDGTQIPDPNPEECGYGVLGSLASGSVSISDGIDSDFDGIDNNDETLLGTKSNKPDSDGDGILDGDEDADGDELTNFEELSDGTTNPKSKDSDKNGVPDGVQKTVTATEKDFVTMPVVVNIMKNSDATEEHIKEAIQKANEVLAQIKVKIVVVKTNTMTENGADDGSGTDGVAGDGLLTPEERKKVFVEGGKEVAMLPGKRGMKITFAHSFGVDLETGSPGKSAHRYQVVLVEPRASTDLTGATIAHEFGHTFTLKHPDKTPEKDDNTDGNVMNEANNGRDDFVNSDDSKKGLKNLSFTDKQKADIAKDKFPEKWGNQGTKQSPGHKKMYQYGAVVDDFEDQSSGASTYNDLDAIIMHSFADDDYIHTTMSMNGLFPNSLLDTTYSLLFDTDANSSTGTTVGSFSGIEKEVVIRVTKNTAKTPISAAGVITNYSLFENELLVPEPTVIIVDEESDDDDSIPLEHMLQFDISKEKLGLTANDIPVGIMVRDTPTTFSSFTEFDTASLVFDGDQYLEDPTLTLVDEFAKSGQEISFDISGLTPGASFDLLIDEQVVLSNTLNSEGSYSGSFTFPAVPTGFHFLTAQDLEGKFAFNGIDLINTFSISNTAIGMVKANNVLVSKNIALTVDGKFDCKNTDPKMSIKNLNGTIVIGDESHELSDIKVTIGKDKTKNVKINAKIKDGASKDRISTSLLLAKTIDCSTPLNVAAVNGKNTMSATVGSTKYAISKDAVKSTLTFGAATNSLVPVIGPFTITQQGTSKGMSVTLNISGNYNYTQADGLDISDIAGTIQVGASSPLTLTFSKFVPSVDMKSFSYMTSGIQSSVSGTIKFKDAVDFETSTKQDSIKGGNIKAKIGSNLYLVKDPTGDIDFI